MRSFIYALLNDEPNQQSNKSLLCFNDPSAIYFAGLFKDLFPNSKFILMVSDPKSTIASIVKQHGQPVSSANITKYVHAWQSLNQKVQIQSGLVGKDSCLLVQYESLITEPKSTMREVLYFLNLKWTKKVLDLQTLVKFNSQLAKKNSQKAEQELLFLEAIAELEKL
jgi:hypothetical protein